MFPRDAFVTLVSTLYKSFNKPKYRAHLQWFMNIYIYWYIYNWSHQDIIVHLRRKQKRLDRVKINDLTGLLKPNLEPKDILPDFNNELIHR